MDRDDVRVAGKKQLVLEEGIKFHQRGKRRKRKERGGGLRRVCL